MNKKQKEMVSLLKPYRKTRPRWEGMMTYRYVEGKGTNIHSQDCIGHACMGRIITRGHPVEGIILSMANINFSHVVHYYDNLEHRENVYRVYHEWLVNYSPYRDAFITKDFKEGQELGLVIDIDIPANIMQGGLAATRMPHEFYRQAMLWFDLVKEDIEPNLAYIIAQYVKPCRRNDKTYYTFDGWAIGHGSLSDTCPRLESLLNFTRNKPINNQPAYRDTGMSRGVTGTWGPIGGQGEVKRHFESHFPTEKIKIPNAWGPDTVLKLVSYETMLKLAHTFTLEK